MPTNSCTGPRLVSKVLVDDALIQSLRKNKRLRGESNIKGLNRQGVNPVLTKEQESAMRDWTVIYEQLFVNSYLWTILL